MFKNLLYHFREKDVPPTPKQFAEMARQMQALIQQTREEHAQLAYTMGNYYGYPPCCSEAFAEDIFHGRDPGKRDIDHSGFIPCPFHYKVIKAGKIKLYELIQNRICPAPFERR